MNHLPVIGNHKIIKVYEFYDKPLIFSAINETKDLYFFSFADITSDGDLWMCVRITPEILNSLETAKLTLREVFTQSATGYVLMFQNCSDGTSRMTYLESNDPRLEEYVAEPGIYLVETPDSEAIVSISAHPLEVEKLFFELSGSAVTYKYKNSNPQSTIIKLKHTESNEIAEIKEKGHLIVFQGVSLSTMPHHDDVTIGFLPRERGSYSHYKGSRNARN